MALAELRIAKEQIAASPELGVGRRQRIAEMLQQRPPGPEAKLEEFRMVVAKRVAGYVPPVCIHEQIDKQVRRGVRVQIEEPLRVLEKAGVHRIRQVSPVSRGCGKTVHRPFDVKLEFRKKLAQPPPLRGRKM